MFIGSKVIVGESGALWVLRCEMLLYLFLLFHYSRLRIENINQTGLALLGPQGAPKVFPKNTSEYTKSTFKV